MKKLITGILISILFLNAGCSKTAKYTSILEEAREGKEKINELNKKETELAKICFDLYKKVEETDRTLMGRNELIFLGRMYERFENNSRKKRMLLHEADYVERKYL